MVVFSYICWMKMDSLVLSGNVCRICLEGKVILDWNEEIFEFSGISYKDCYYKYTQLDKRDSDCYPSNLCEMCADELKNAHFLFEKALESFNILQVTFNTKNLQMYCGIEPSNTQLKIQRQIDSSKVAKRIQLSDVLNPADDNILTEHLSNTSDNESTAESENTINNSKEDVMRGNSLIEPCHFIDIQNLESCDDTSGEQKFSDEYPNRKSSNSRCITNRNKVTSISISSSVKKVTKLPESKDINYASQSFGPQNPIEKCDANSLLPATNNQTFKKRKKYILICQYCSLKVNGTSQLKTHEATHSENRKRTETCPQCGVKLYTKMALNEHLKIHDENRQKKYKCEFCEKAFFNKGALNVHRRVHLGKMVKCQLCPKEFFRQIDLDKHLLKHSVSPLQKNVIKKKYVVQCQYCDKSVLTDKWREHLAAHMDQPQMKCKICDKKFFSRSNCTKHLRQVHHKNLSEYEDSIHYLVDRNLRITNLRMRQQLAVQQLTE